MCKSRPQKPQEALNLSVTEERYWAPFYMPLYTFLHNLLNVVVKNLRGLTQRVNYTDRVTATCQRS
jgi:hypothetical protein